MKKLIALILVVALAIPTVALSKGLELESTEFSGIEYSAPSGWVSAKADSGTTIYHYAQTVGSADGGMFMLMVSDISSMSNVSEDDEATAYMLLGTLADAMGGELNPDGIEKERIMINGHYAMRGHVNMNIGTVVSTTYVHILFGTKIASIIAINTMSMEDQDGLVEQVAITAHLPGEKVTSKAFEPAPTPLPKNKYGKFSYKTVARNPEKSKGEKVKIAGTVVQVTGTRTTGYVIRLATSKGYDDIVYLTVPIENMPDYNILDKDKLTVYATLTGEYTYQSTLGGAITLPSASANIVEVND